MKYGSLEPVKHFALQAVLQLATSDHVKDDLLHGLLRILLLDKVLDNRVLGDLRSDGESSL